MKLPNNAIEEFQKLWQEQTGESISFEIASKQADSFLLGIQGVFNGEHARDGPLK